MAGKFFVIDGNDGSGKATQAKLLAAHFSKQGIPALHLDFPGYERNFFGALVGECLAGLHGDFVHLDPKIASTLYACDRLESSALIERAKAEGKIVIADRFASSNQIHQGGKISDETERIAFLKWLDRMEHEVLGIPRPDAIVYLRVPTEVSLKLLLEKRRAKNHLLDEGKRDTVEEDRMYLERSSATADWLASRESNWSVVECMAGERLRQPEEIHAEVRAVLNV